PEPKPEPKPVKTEPVKTPLKDTTANNAAVKLDNARKQAASAGVMQAQNELAAMRDSLDISDVAKPTETTAAPGANTAATVDRAVISSGALAKSGGISVAALSKDTGGGGSLGGRKGTAVENKLKDADQAAAAKQAAASAGGGKGSRTDEELKRVLGAAQARIDRMYRSALDVDPTLQGRMVFKLTIEPNGSVSNVQLVSSALKDDDLQRKVTTLLRSLNFGARDVAVFTQSVPIDFFPS
ncbi:MAG TPA: AgmX/PglI C-terminal domain-containing protein, partial [Cellvibrionaceae bacterium]|nr:AgmX/PglI C-terminal domain-containing protein [Cellvibrionaceae bacterium]